MKKTIAGAASAVAVVAVIAVTACSGGTTTIKEVPAALPVTHTSAPAKPSPAVTKTVTAKPAPAVTKTAAPSVAPVIINNNVPATTPAPVYVAPAAPPAPVDNYDPYAVVSQYYADVESGDYSNAWDMGGSTLSENYSDFVTGYENTGAQSISENWESGGTASIDLSAVDNAKEDDPTQYFTCQYTVDQNVGTITGGSCTQTGGPS
jgi:hypothetical protein